MNIYLDIDGVLIHDSLENYQKITDGLIDFLKYITENYNCYWLTTHCKGDTVHLLEYLGDRFPEEAMQYVKLLQPTNWQTMKTEAIDFSQDFRWIDDDVFDKELSDLRDNNCEEKLIHVNLINNPNQLKDIMKLL